MTQKADRAGPLRRKRVASVALFRRRCEMNIHKSFGAAAALVFTISFALLFSALPVSSQVVSDKNSDRVTLLVTAVPSGDRERGIAEKLEPSDFAVLENKKEQKILSVKKVTDSPMNVAVL